MKIKAGQLVNARPVLRKLASASFPARDAYRIARLVAKLNAELEAAEKVRVDLIKKYGEEKDGNVQVTSENVAAFLAELEPVFATEIEIDAHPLPMTILDNAPEMTAEEILALEPFLSEAE